MAAGADDILAFWFGALEPGRPAAPATSARWFARDDAFDREIGERFGAVVETALEGRDLGWAPSPRARLAQVIVLDQFPRNLFRGSGRSYAGDAAALRVARHAVAEGDEAALHPIECTFLYLPWMHSEALEDQDACVARFAALADRVPEALRDGIRSNLDYAERHRAVIRRFGRFPHRNAELGRTPTDEETDWLAERDTPF